MLTLAGAYNIFYNTTWVSINETNAQDIWKSRRQRSMMTHIYIQKSRTNLGENSFVFSDLVAYVRKSPPT